MTSIKFKRGGVLFILSWDAHRSRYTVEALTAGEHDEGKADARQLSDGLWRGMTFRQCLNELALTAGEICDGNDEGDGRECA